MSGCDLTPSLPTSRPQLQSTKDAGDLAVALQAASPAEVLPFPPEPLRRQEDEHGDRAAVVQLWDVLPASLVHYVVTNAQAVAPAQVARLVDETFG